MRRSLALAVLSLAAVAACHKEKSHAEFAQIAQTGATAEALGAGDVRITTTDSSLDMALIGDHIAVRLADKARAKVQQETDTSKIQGSGFAASLEKSIKGAVGGALLTHEQRIPLTDLRDIRDDNGRIVFEWNAKPSMDPDKQTVNNRKLTEAFSAADARRFVTAVRARKGLPAQ